VDSQEVRPDERLLLGPVGALARSASLNMATRLPIVKVRTASELWACMERLVKRLSGG
jgi:hypothetical protein